MMKEKVLLSNGLDIYPRLAYQLEQDCNICKMHKRKMTDIISESNQKHYAIAIPFVDDENLLLQVRSDKLDRQPGDNCFPGGAVEDGETPEEAVRRELFEELLLSKEQIEIQEETSLLVSDSAIIHCFPCRIFNYTGSFSREEVAEVFLVPISFFETTPAKVYTVAWEPVFPSDFPFDKIHGGRNYGWRPRKSRIRFYEYGRRVIWGMTARIIENYVHSTRKR